MRIILIGINLNFLLISRRKSILGSIYFDQCGGPWLSFSHIDIVNVFLFVLLASRPASEVRLYMKFIQKR